MTTSTPRQSQSREDFGQRLSDTVRDNPIPAALVGMGVLWLFMGGNRTTFAQIGAEARASSGTASPANLASKLADTGKQAGESVAEAGASAAKVAAESAAELVSGAAETVSEATDALQRGGSQLIRTVQRDLSDLFERQPLAVGALGLVVGAAVGSAFQASKVEAEVFGETSQAVKKQAEELVSAGLDSAGRVAAGLTENQSGAGEAITRATDKIGAVADTALDAMKTEVRDAGRRKDG